MTENNEKQKILLALQLQDDFAGAKVAQDILHDVPEDALPTE